MPTFKQVIKLTAQVVLSSYAALAVSNLVGNLFDRLTNK